jgi:CubicO group peptidase (beta-lactamase class C family)
MFVAMGSGYPVTRVLAESSSLNMLYAFQAWARDNKVPNASFVATQNAQEVISTGWGSWNPNTIAPIASNSKAITAQCILTLINAHKLDMGSTVQQLLPAFTKTLDPNFQFNAASVRVEGLLRHASGLNFDPTQGSNFGTGATNANPDQVFARQALNRTLSGVGTTYFYNNTNYAILGLIIKTITGQSYESYCKSAVLTPNGAPNARIGAGVRAMEAFGGWEISAHEYSNFYVRAFDRKRLDSNGVAGVFMNSGPSPSFVISGCAGCNYGLGVIVVPVGTPATGPLARHNLFHHGDWSSTVTTPREFASFAAAWTTTGYTAVVIYDHHLPTDAGRNALDNALRNASATN